MFQEYHFGASLRSKKLKLKSGVEELNWSEEKYLQYFELRPLLMWGREIMKVYLKKLYMTVEREPLRVFK